MNIPTPEQAAEAEAAVEAAVEDLGEALSSLLLRLSRIENPIARAKAVARVRSHLTGEMAEALDPLYRDAAIEAYARGKTESGWYGYGALAEELGLSRSRAQQIVNGTWKRAEKDTGLVESLRAAADRERIARRLLAAGVSPEKVAAQVGISVAEARSFSG